MIPDSGPANASWSITVPANAPSAPAGTVSEGEIWSFESRGRWRDRFIRCGPDGYRFFPFDILDIHPRVSGHPWMQLMGRVTPGGAPFPIGQGTTRQMDASGQLEVFANDQPGRYGNNDGAVMLRAARLEAWPTQPQPGGFWAHWGRWRRAMARTQGFLFVAAIVLLACGALVGTSQGRDLVRTVGEGGPAGFKGQVAFVTATLFLGVQAWFWPRMIINANYGHERKDWPAPRTLVWAPRLLGVVPFLAAVLGLLYTPERETGLVTALVLCGFAFFVAVIRHNDVIGPEAARRLGRGWTAICLVGAIVSMAFVVADPVTIPRWIGAPAVAFVGLGLLIFPSVVLIQIGAALRFPMTGAVLLAAFLFSFWVDNHEVGRRAGKPTSAEPPAERPTLETAYKAWRETAPVHDGRRVMVLVAAEGGASRAGYWTAEVLGALHDGSGGRFPRSLFAISAVSGANVGAVGYVTALQDDPLGGGPVFRDRLRRFAGADYLSPAMAGMLFPDLFQRLLPFSLMPDRAEALERGLEASWAKRCGKETCADGARLARPFLEIGPEPDGWRPLLLANGAHQETGRRILTSPIAFSTEEIDADDFHAETKRDVPLSTVVMNSARFPWLSPAGTLTRYDGKGRRERRGHIIDGGYFDAAGAATLRELSHAIESGPGKGDALTIIHVFIGYRGRTTPSQAPFNRAGLPLKQGLREEVETHRAGNDVLAPLAGLFSSRQAHGALLMRQLKAQATPQAANEHPFVPSVPPPPPPPPADGEAAGQAWKLYEPVLLCDLDCFPMPMDWALSKRAKDLMAKAVAAGGCPGAADGVQRVSAILRASELPVRPPATSAPAS